MPTPLPLRIIESRPTLPVFCSRMPVPAPSITPPEPAVSSLLPKTAKEPGELTSLRPTVPLVLLTASRLMFIVVLSMSTAVPLVAEMVPPRSVVCAC